MRSFTDEEKPADHVHGHEHERVNVHDSVDVHDDVNECVFAKMYFRRSLLLKS